MPKYLNQFILLQEVYERLCCFSFLNSLHGQSFKFSSCVCVRWLSGKEFTYNAGAAGAESLIPGSERSPGGGHGKAFQYSCLKNPMDRGAWWVTIHRDTKSWTLLKQLRVHTCTSHIKIEKRKIVLGNWNLHHLMIDRDPFLTYPDM